MKLIFVLLAVLSVQVAHANDIQAKGCQIFVKQVIPHPNSHGSAGMETVVKVNWIGNDEHIQKVGFYGFTYAEDLGNAPECHNGSGSSTSVMKIIDPVNPGWGHSPLAYGEYSFSFGVTSGSVDSRCHGWKYSATGSYFVQTDKNTYWLNPNFDSNQHYVIDQNAFNRLMTTGAYGGASTLRPDLRYYNPGACQ